MTKKLSNAVSRLRKAQTAALNGKIKSHTCVMITIQAYCCHYEDYDHTSIGVMISRFGDEDNGYLHWYMDEDGCEICGGEDLSMTHEEFLQHVSDFLGYPV